MANSMSVSTQRETVSTDISQITFKSSHPQPDGAAHPGRGRPGNRARPRQGAWLRAKGACEKSEYSFAVVAKGGNNTFYDCILRFRTKKSSNRRPVDAKIRVLDTTVAHGEETAMRAVKSVPFLLAAAIRPVSRALGIPPTSSIIKGVPQVIWELMVWNSKFFWSSPHDGYSGSDARSS